VEAFRSDGGAAEGVEGEGDEGACVGGLDNSEAVGCAVGGGGAGAGGEQECGGEQWGEKAHGIASVSQRFKEE
jgi:hypothetical protein